MKNVEQSKSRTDVIERIRLIRNCRFNAERRMVYHNRAYIWTMTFTSLFLIIIPLIDALHVHSFLGYSLQNAPVENSQFIQISLGVIVLVLSQVISSQNFTLRGHNFHECATDLDNLLSRSEILCNDANFSAEHMVDEYHLILAKCENHSVVDFICAKFEEHWNDFKLIPLFSSDKLFKGLFLIYIRAIWLTRFLLGFSPYAAILILQIIGFRALYF